MKRNQMKEGQVRPMFLTRALLVLNGIVWLVFGIISLFRIAGNQNLPSWGVAIIALLMGGNAGAMLLSAWLLSKKRWYVYLFVLLVLFVNVILTFTDQFGIFDLVTLLLDLIILALLVIYRPQFVPTVSG